MKIFKIVFLKVRSAFPSSQWGFSALCLAFLLTVSFHITASAFSMTFWNHKIPSDILGEDLPSDVREVLLSDLEYLKNLNGHQADELHQSLWGKKVDGERYLKWFLKRVDSISSGTEQDCTDNPTLEAYVRTKGSIRLCQGFFGRSFFSQTTTVKRVAALMHEAVHAAQAEHSQHVECRYNPADVFAGGSLPFEDRPGLLCDSDLSGAYGAQVIFLANIALYCDNCSASDKWDALQLAFQYSARILSNRIRLELAKRYFRQHSLAQSLTNNNLKGVKYWLDIGVPMKPELQRLPWFYQVRSREAVDLVMQYHPNISWETASDPELPWVNTPWAISSYHDSKSRRYKCAAGALIRLVELGVDPFRRIQAYLQSPAESPFIRVLSSCPESAVSLLRAYEGVHSVTVGFAQMNFLPDELSRILCGNSSEIVNVLQEFFRRGYPKDWMIKESQDFLLGKRSCHDPVEPEYKKQLEEFIRSIADKETDSSQK